PADGGARADARAARRNRLRTRHRRAAHRRERRERFAARRSCDRDGHALPAVARLHRTRSRPRAFRRPYSEERRQVAGARTGEARLRLGQAGGGGRMSVVTLQESRSSSERYRAAFDARWTAADPLVELRRAALERFVAAGFPTQRQEDWKYTNLSRLEARSFAPATSAAVAI